jgi:hypothetical protein
MVTAMDAPMQQRLADQLRARDRLVVQRQAHADSSAASLVALVNQEITELDREIEQTCREALRMTSWTNRPNKPASPNAKRRWPPSSSSVPN